MPSRRLPIEATHQPLVARVRCLFHPLACFAGGIYIASSRPALRKRDCPLPKDTNDLQRLAATGPARERLRMLNASLTTSLAWPIAIALLCGACQDVFSDPSPSTAEGTDQELLRDAHEAVNLALRGDDVAERAVMVRLRSRGTRVAALLQRELERAPEPGSALTRWALTRTLGGLEAEAAIRVLAKEAERVSAPLSGDDLAPYAALSGLERLAARGSAQARDALISLLHHRDSTVRSAALDSIISVDPNWALTLETELPPEERHLVHRRPVLESGQERSPGELKR